MNKRMYSTNSGLNTQSGFSLKSVLADLGFDVPYQVFDTSVVKTENVALGSGNKESSLEISYQSKERQI